jgi:hypothetical protein
MVTLRGATRMPRVAKILEAIVTEVEIEIDRLRLMRLMRLSKRLRATTIDSFVP